MANQPHRHTTLNTVVLLSVLLGFGPSSPNINIQLELDVIQIATEQHPHSLPTGQDKNPAAEDAVRLLPVFPGCPRPY
ncbi:hypothetical protein ABIE61_000318 [Marinobacterium sp. MBR-111]|jgi:hypothetical protein|uniref:hypothetical protein n=1 Tax=Marinobacterium sp. MBR-111 TaxID=3156463 RepID=UPI003390C308